MDLLIKAAATKKKQWLETAGGEAGKQFWAKHITNLYKEVEEKMIEKNENSVAEPVVETSVETPAPAADESLRKEVETLIETLVKEVITPLTEAVAAQNAKIAELEAKAVTPVVKEVVESEAPTASLAAILRNRLMKGLQESDELNGTPIAANDPITKEKPPVVETFKSDDWRAGLLTGV